MLLVEHTPHKNTEHVLRRSISVAEHYGFLPIESVMPEYGLRRKSKMPQYATYLSAFDNELAGIVRSYIEHGHARLSEPTLFYQQGINRKDPTKIFFGLHILGSSHSIAEAFLIKTALATLDELGIKERCVHVNSVGDRDSANRFTKELTSYLRRHLNDLPGYSRQAMKKDVFYAYGELLKKQHELCAEAPTTVEFLTESSRKHLSEVLEYFEIAQVEYELNPTLIGHGDCYSKTLFEIRALPKEDDDEILIYARGGRYDELSKKAFRQHIPAAGIIFEYEKRGRLPKKLSRERKWRPKFYFIQLGFEARLRSLVVLEMLRQAHISVYQSLGKSQLAEHLKLAEQLEIPYCIIMGHKEALERSVIVRNMDTRAQETIVVDGLPRYLKSI
ncbi:ATP phosphoribosyltransferase regulatory subunit [Candidatus Kaiserbacteria bacterium]|nr:ATP phosphoribosyltransferase regulatory subunit [Candidatus Kaiserbacteria bacterium]